MSIQRAQRWAIEASRLGAELGEERAMRARLFAVLDRESRRCFGDLGYGEVDSQAELRDLRECVILLMALERKVGAMEVRYGAGGRTIRYLRSRFSDLWDLA